MALVKSKPTSPGKRFQVRAIDRKLSKEGPYEPLLESLGKSGGRNNKGRITTRHVGGGHKRRYRVDRFPSRQGRHSGRGRARRVRPEPHRAHLPASEVRRRRASLHDRAEGRRRRVLQLMSGREAPIKVGNSCRSPTSRSARRALHRAQARTRRAGRAQRRRRSAAGRPRRPVRHAPAALRARPAASSPSAAPRSARSATASTPCRSSARRAPCAGAASAHGSRCRDEPGRSPARWRRGPHLGRSSPGQPLGHADEGSQDPLQQAHRPHDRASSLEEIVRTEQREGIPCREVSRRVRSSTPTSPRRWTRHVRPTASARSAPGRAAR